MDAPTKRIDLHTPILRRCAKAPVRRYQASRRRRNTTIRRSAHPSAHPDSLGQGPHPSLPPGGGGRPGIGLSVQVCPVGLEQCTDVPVYGNLLAQAHRGSYLRTLTPKCRICRSRYAVSPTDNYLEKTVQFMSAQCWLSKYFSTRCNQGRSWAELPELKKHKTAF